MDKKKTDRQIWLEIVGKANKDANFKKELLAHPEKVLKAHGIEIHDGWKAKIIQDEDHTSYWHFPAHATLEKLSKGSIGKIGGGGTGSPVLH